MKPSWLVQTADTKEDLLRKLALNNVAAELRIIKSQRDRYRTRIEELERAWPEGVPMPGDEGDEEATDGRED